MVASAVIAPTAIVRLYELDPSAVGPALRRALDRVYAKLRAAVYAA